MQLAYDVFFTFSYEIIWLHHIDVRINIAIKEGCLVMSVKFIYVLNSFHMLFISILYPYSCKNYNISSKLSFLGFLMESK